MKFEVGDRVKYDGNALEINGLVGTIVGIDKNEEAFLPYAVSFEGFTGGHEFNGFSEEIGNIFVKAGSGLWCDEDALVLADDLVNSDNYVELAMRTYDGKAFYRLNNTINDLEPMGKNRTTLINACLGLAGEVGEFNDMVKKMIFHETETDMEHLKKELGDIMWYVAQACYSMNWTLDEVMTLNIKKLKERYPEGFSVERANNRKEGDV